MSAGNTAPAPWLLYINLLLTLQQLRFPLPAILLYHHVPVFIDVKTELRHQVLKRDILAF